jgi:small subunit ribosomal protein S6
LNAYELAVLFHPDLEVNLDKATDKIEKTVADNGGKITNTDNWGRRKLAYPIKKQDFAVYVFYAVEMPAENVAKVEQTLNITDEIIRFMVVRPDLKAQAKAEALKAEKEKKAAERGDKEDDDKNNEQDEE